MAAAFLLPWERLPDWAWLIIPIGYIAVIAIIRDAQGGSDSGLVVVYLLPIVWLSLYGRRLHLLVGLFCMDLALLVPLLLVGPPKYPTLEWRQVAVMATVTTLVASTVYTMVSRDRAFLADLAQQSRMARRNAREADYARDRLETLLRAATGSAIMGVDPAGTVTFFSAGAEQMLGYRAAEVVGIHSIADFIDPAQIDERRQTIDAMRTALEPSRCGDGGRGPVDRDPQGRPAAALRRASARPARADARPRLDEEWARRRVEHADEDADRLETAGRPRPTGCAADQRGLRRGRHRRDRARGAGRRPGAPLRHSEGSHAVAHRAEQPAARADPDEGRRGGHGVPRAAHADHLHPGLRRAAARRHRPI